MPRFLIAILIASLTPLAKADAQTTETWKETRSQEGNLRVLLPGEGQYLSEEIDSDVGKMTQHTYLAEVDGGRLAFLTIYNDYPADQVRRTGAAEVLKNAQGGALKSVNGKLKRDARPIKLGNHPGREFHFTGVLQQRKLNMTWRVYMVGNRMYQLGIVGVEREIPESDQKKFFDSFKLLRAE